MINYSIADRKYTQSSHVQHIGLFLGVKRHSLIRIIFKLNNNIIIIIIIIDASASKPTIRIM